MHDTTAVEWLPNFRMKLEHCWNKQTNVFINFPRLCSLKLCLPMNVRSHECMRWNCPQSIGIIAQKSGHRRCAHLTQLIDRQIARICFGTMLVEIPITLTETRKLIGNNFGKNGPQQCVTFGRFQQTAHPQINVVRMSIHLCQFSGSL